MQKQGFKQGLDLTPGIYTEPFNVIWYEVEKADLYFNRRFFGKDAVDILREMRWMNKSREQDSVEKPKRALAVRKQGDIKLEEPVVERNRREGK